VDLLSEERQETSVKPKACPLSNSSSLPCLGHEIRTNLNALIGTVDLIADGAQSEHVKRYAEICRENSESLLSFLQQLDTLNELESQSTNFSSERFNLYDVLNTAAEKTKSRCYSRGVFFKAYISEGLKNQIFAPKSQLSLLLTHLFENVVKHTQDDIVRFRADLSDRVNGHLAFTFSIVDPGIGVASDNLGSAFRRFEQHSTEKFKYNSGNSIDLTLAKRLIDHLGGNFSYEYTPEEGSIMKVNLSFPTSSGMSLLVDRHKDSAIEETMQKLKVLMAEDSENNRLLVEMYLKNGPYELTCVPNGERAVKATTEDSFDIILMDMQMPVMDGYEATEKIRQWEKDNGKSPLPILAITAHTMSADNERSMAAGCDGLLKSRFKNKS
jgi:CheY-like chemotaxis protein